ncbi:replication-relaxation family protein [Kitasatospora cathayae]|uniref:Replication-relaxation family protein n=1 Tax=Kitasatospora cathayae TaxID=3004092 RepID=A0ABY7QFA3_9ACTN|nr:replication-relaxation family protein [Kitasatospora sp. HUAS 3-15]WBP91403.1 replication-relaxation family protein [Kitasatospora sp. HUAS 3-15]
MATPPEIDHHVVAALYQFRMATAEQLRVLHTPDSKPELMRRRLRKLKDEGLVEDVVLPQAGRLRAWFLTERGARIAARFPELENVASPPLPEDKTEARLRVGHILAVTRTQVAFVAGARKAGDECAPLDFLPEIYHRVAALGAQVGDGREVEQLAQVLVRHTAGGRAAEPPGPDPVHSAPPRHRNHRRLPAHPTHDQGRLERVRPPGPGRAPPAGLRSAGHTLPRQ